MITHESYRGGSETNGAVSLSPSTPLRLTDSRQWCHLDAPASEEEGSVAIILPFAKGLPLGTTFRIVFTASSTHDTIIVNNSLGAQTIFDAGGVPRGSIDHSTLNWTDTTAVDVVLLGNTNGNGFWLLFSWGD